MSSCRAKETVERVGIHCQRVDQDLRVVQVKATMCHRVMGRRRPSKVSNGSTNLCSLNKHKPSILRVMLNLSLSFTHFFLPRRLSNYPFLWLFSGSTQSMASCAHCFTIFPGHASTDGRVRGFAIRPENFRGQPHQRSGEAFSRWHTLYSYLFVCAAGKARPTVHPARQCGRPPSTATAKSIFKVTYVTIRCLSHYLFRSRRRRRQGKHDLLIVFSLSFCLCCSGRY